MTTDENDRLRRTVEEDAHEIGRLRKLLAYLVSDEMRTRIACVLAKQPNHVEREAGAVVELIREVQQDTGYLTNREPLPPPELTCAPDGCGAYECHENGCKRASER